MEKPQPMSSKTVEAKEGIDKRTIKAAVESMALDPHTGGPGEYDVYSESGEVYRVSLISGTCECPAAEYQDGACKHERRVEMELGERDVPELGRETDVERMIESRERLKDQPQANTDASGDAKVMADGGQATYSPSATIGPVDDSVGTGLDLEDLLGTYVDVETGAVFETGFDERAGVIRTRDFTTGIIDGDGQVPELFERRVGTGRYEEADVVDAAAAWAAWDTAERIRGSAH